MSASWHPDEIVLARYATGEGTPMDGASVEQHLMACSTCRGRMSEHVAPEPLREGWFHILDEVQAPPPGSIQRVLTRLGVSEWDSVLVAAAPSLRTSWLAGVAGALAFAGVAAAYGGTRGLTAFLLLAPLVPMVGVAFAYGPDADPAYEVGVATPYAGARLLFLRSAAVLATSIPLALAASLLIPGLAWTAFAWLLPALGFTALVLAASTWVRPVSAAVALGIAWASAVGTAAVDHDPVAVLAPRFLLGYVALGIGALVVLHFRIHRLAPMRGPS